MNIDTLKPAQLHIFEIASVFILPKYSERYVYF